MEQIARSKEVSFWIREIELYERKFASWEKRSKKICKRYKDDEEGRKRSQFNILWSNVQTLVPATYNSPPKPNIDRRFQDDDDAGRLSAQVLERATSYFVSEDRCDTSLRQATLDRFLAGRGQVWVRYAPKITEAAPTGQITDDVEQILESEDLEYDYVHWQDFGHTNARTWQEVRAVWRIVPLDRKELTERFGDAGKELPLDGKKDDNDDMDCRKASVYEIWDSKTRKVYWISKNSVNALDIKDDPLGLKEFFPCPRPVYATLDNNSLVPTPDFILYQDQAIELDTLTQRIASLTKAIKVVGIYDASAEALQRLLSEGLENKMIPVENFAVMGANGGIKGAVDFFPIEMVVATVTSLYQARDKIKQDIYEITGISDIVRGATNANETATAQQIKGQYANLRLGDMQKELARFGRDLVRISAEIIAEHFSVETLRNISGIKLLTNQEKKNLELMLQSGQQATEELQELLQKPSWEDVEAILRNDAARSFRIDIETDSTIKADQDAEKASRVEFLGAVGGFIQQAAQAPADLQPLLLDLLEFGVRGFRVGRELETTFKMTADKIKKAAEQPQEQQPDPAVMQAQADAQMKQAEIDGKMQLEQQKMQMENQRANADMDIKQQELAIKERELTLKESALKLDERRMILDAKANVSEDVAMSDSDLNGGISPLLILAQQMQADNQATQQALQMIAQGQQIMIEQLSRPKVVKRDNTGKVVGVE